MYYSCNFISYYIRESLFLAQKLCCMRVRVRERQWRQRVMNEFLCVLSWYAIVLQHLLQQWLWLDEHSYKRKETRRRHLETYILLSDIRSLTYCVYVTLNIDFFMVSVHRMIKDKRGCFSTHIFIANSQKYCKNILTEYNISHSNHYFILNKTWIFTLKNNKCM